jgi:structural maintenance of chromosomes protein 5
MSEDMVIEEHLQNDRDEDVHQPGAIVRIRMRNFVTYSSAEFNCGPSLNMIIGPNGTGKSTLVCAICLGLGWHPQILGRAKEVGEFVKNGYREADIEIELKAGPRHRNVNPVVKRVIRREGNKSTWFINGASVTRGEVQKLMKYFHIQIDNLCQFLPQDKVVEFSRLSPVQLLEQTERAVGTEEMTQWHERLKELGAAQKQRSNDLNTAQNHLSGLQATQDRLRHDVEQVNELKSLKSRLHALEKARPALKYELAKIKVQELKDQANRAKLELDVLNEEVEPAMRDVTCQADYIENITSILGQRKATTTSCQDTAKESTQKIKDKKDAIESHRSEIEHAQTARKKCNKTISQLTQRLSSEEQRLAEGQPASNIPELNERKREAERTIRHIRAEKISPLATVIEEHAAKLVSRRNRDAEIHKELSQLSTKHGQQQGKLTALSQDTSKAWEWIQQNQSKFRDQIYGPALVTCSIKDDQFDREIETLLQNQDFTAFTVTNRDDYKKLSNFLFDEMHFKDIAIRTQSQSLASKRQTINDSLLERFGFDRWAVDALEGPDMVLSMLCDSAFLHRTPMTKRKMTAQEEEALLNSPIQQWVAGAKLCSVKRRREYGASAVTTLNRPLKPKAVYWTGAGLEPQIQALKAESERNAEEAESIKKDLTAARQENKSLLEEIKKLENTIVSITACSRNLTGLETIQ